ncbi:thioredoxin [bacterium]|nr:thioredoxin [bacterium]
MSGLPLTNDNFEAEALNYQGNVIIDFWATWCGPCKAFMPIVEAFAAKRPDIKFCTVNVDEAPEIAERYEVMSIPTLVFLKNGETKEISVGSLPPNVLEAKAEKAFA